MAEAHEGLLAKEPSGTRARMMMTSVMTIVAIFQDEAANTKKFVGRLPEGGIYTVKNYTALPFSYVSIHMIKILLR
jgi:hypothetical protein